MLSNVLKKQIDLLGIPLILKAKNGDLDYKDLSIRLEYLKEKKLVPSNYTINKLTEDTKISFTFSS
jgi:hypothetical protein